MAIKSSVVIEFKIKCESDTESSYINVELDDDLNKGRTCFLYGEKVYFRVNYSDNLIISIKSSSGSIFFEYKDRTSIETENISFVDSEESTTSKTIFSIISYKWFGASLGTILKTGDSTVRASNSGIALAELNYNTKYDVYSVVLSAQSEETFPVLIVVIGTDKE